MDTQNLDAAESRLRDARNTLDHIRSRRLALEAELDAIIAEREDAHFNALIADGHDHGPLERLITLNTKVAALRAENSQFRATLAATLAELEV